MKKSAVRALVIIVYIVIVLGFLFVGLPWAVQTTFSIFEITVTYEQALALISLVMLILEALKD